MFKFVPPVSAIPSASKAAEKTVRNPEGTGTILVVDDEETIRTVAKRTLERRGYSVILAEDGRIALEIMERDGGRIDVVLLDLTMPGITGDQLLPLLRKIRRDLPVIVSTGYGRSEVGRLMGTEGVEFLQKPYTGEQLASKVKDLINGSENAGSVH
jgi:two-component system, cell cycle sensor histidine kinase and response regulator CckA